MMAGGIIQAAVSSHRPLDGAEPLIAHAGPFAASPDALSNWALHSAEGRMCLYARAALCPRDVAKRARELMGQGILTLRRTRHEAGADLFDFAARRTSNPFRLSRAHAGEQRLLPEAMMLLDVLAHFADDGAPCPGNDELAALIGVRSGSRAGDFIARLSQAQLIHVHPDGAPPWRRIEIMETGARTGLRR